MKHEEVRFLRSYCGKYHEYRQKSEDLAAKLKETEYRMRGVSAVSYGLRMQNSCAADERLLRYMEKADALRQQINRCQSRADRIENLIGSCRSEADRVLLWQAFVEHASLRSLASMYNVSEKTVSKRIRDAAVRLAEVAEPAE